MEWYETGGSKAMIRLNWIYTGFKVCAGLMLLQSTMPQPSAQDEASQFRVNVVLVQLNVAVTDNKGNYVTGLRPEDFVITEDNIHEKIANFEEGDEWNVKAPSLATAPAPSPSTTDAAGAPASESVNISAPAPAPEGPAHVLAGTKVPGLSGANVFILFDTSNYMYRGFVFAQDAISDFIRTMPDASKIAFYSYSRDLSRAATLTTNRFRVVSGVRNTVAGDDAALYNSLLLTVKDAAPLQGRKAIVVFSNGPDNASSVPPEDVAELAESTGSIIYIVSTREAQSEPISSAAFERISKATGGKAYFARNWRQEKDAFASIRDDLTHLYTLSYYPQANPNRGWRTIKVQLVGKRLSKYHIRTRDGYSLMQQAAVTNEAYAAPPESTSHPR
jgi:Ca-activated chloride channel family protein